MAGHQRTETEFLVLHTLRLKMFAATDVIASTTGVASSKVTATLGRLAEGGLARHREGAITGWQLTPDGKARHTEALAAETTSDPGGRAVIDAEYRRFLGLNGELLAVCTDWQLRDGDVNDHSDATYDKAVITRLGAIDDGVQPICAALTATLARFGRYGPRLAAAMSKLEAGAGEWFAKPMIDSYHTVWFELHEDLLVTLGLERSKEGA